MSKVFKSVLKIVNLPDDLKNPNTKYQGKKLAELAEALIVSNLEFGPWVLEFEPWTIWVLPPHLYRALVIRMLTIYIFAISIITL